MTIETELYWTLLETDLHNEDLYLPPDTPLGKVNSVKLYKQLKYRHQRQKSRLLQQQVSELAEYQEKFSVQYEEDFLFLKPQVTACQLIRGSDYLATCQKEIEALICSIPKQTVKKEKEEGEESDDEKRRKQRKLERNAQERKQNYLGILKKKYNAGFEIIEEKLQEELDKLLEMQKLDLSGIPSDILDPPIIPASRERGRTRSSGGGRSSLSPLISSSSRSKQHRLSPSSTTSSTASSPTRRPNTEEDIIDIRKAKRRRGEDGKEKRYDRHSSKRSTTDTSSWHYSAQQQQRSSYHDGSRYPTTPTPSPTCARGPPNPITSSTSFSIYDNNEINNTPNNNDNRPQNTPNQNRVYNRPTNTTSRGPPPVTSSSSSGQSGPPPIATSGRGPPPVASNRGPPTVAPSSSNRGPPSVAAVPISNPSNKRGPPPVNVEPRAYFGSEAEFNGTRIVAGGVHVSQPPRSSIPRQQQAQPVPPPQQQQQTAYYGVGERRDSLPFFQSTRPPYNPNPRPQQQQRQQQPRTWTANSLLDKGDMVIRNKPTRVVIRGPNGTETVYGNPKDYDDAMNSSNQRHDNPVSKRRMPDGQDYLFYKTEMGAIITIGPVAKIQPLIHKFLLAL